MISLKMMSFKMKNYDSMQCMLSEVYTVSYDCAIIWLVYSFLHLSVWSYQIKTNKILVVSKALNLEKAFKIMRAARSLIGQLLFSFDLIG